MTSSYFPFGPPAGKFHEDDPRKITLLEPFLYVDEEKDIWIAIPEGYVSDGNSVPKAFQGYFGRWEIPEAGVVHDWLYDHPEAYKRLSTDAPQGPLDKAACDDIHRRILHLKGVRWSKRQVLWSILRSAGFHAWGQHRQRDTILDVVVPE
jgi:hypothetical protein